MFTWTFKRTELPTTIHKFYKPVRKAEFQGNWEKFEGEDVLVLRTNTGVTVRMSPDSIREAALEHYQSELGDAATYDWKVFWGAEDDGTEALFVTAEPKPWERKREEEPAVREWPGDEP